jgi:hypothetical protein
MSKGGYHGGSTVIHAGSGWLGKGSVTSQPGEKKKKQHGPARSKPKKKASKSKVSTPKTGNGLTRAEIVARAARKVRTLESEIAKTQRTLARLQRDHAAALVEVEEAKNLPSLTATSAVPSRVKVENTSEPVITEADAQRVTAANTALGRRIITRNNPKGVLIEHRPSQKQISKERMKP